MKIAIPVDEKSLKLNVCVSFGRAPYFLIYDTETKESVFLDNIAAASVLLTPRCGENAANVLKSADIKIYKTKDISAKKNIDDFISGKLSLLDEIHPGFHGHGRGGN